MSALRTAIIGAGKVGRAHADALRSLPDSAFVAVCGRRPDHTAAFAADYGVTPYTDAAAMLREARIDAVILCTPHPLHAEHAVLAASMGVHVLVEKPMALRVEDCDRMIDAAARARVQLGVVSQRRFYPAVRRMRAAVDAGKIGAPLLAESIMLSWRDEAYYRSDPWRGQWTTEGGGVLVNQAPHQLDLLLWFMGAATDVMGCWGNINHPYIEVEDTAAAVVRFASGGMATLLASNSQKPGLYSRTHLHGSNGASVGVQTDGGAMLIAGMPTPTEPPINDLWTIEGEADQLATVQAEDRAYHASIDLMTHYLRLQDEDFLRAVIDHGAPAVTGEDGRAVVALFNAIYAANDARRAVAVQ